MAAGTVTASKLNFRSSPSLDPGNIIKTLNKDDVVEILEHAGEWLKVNVDGETGFVSAHFVREEEALPDDGNAVPPATNMTLVSGACKFVGNDAVAPDGTKFATKFKLGVFNFGSTTIGQFIKNHSSIFANIAPSRIKIMQAVSANEGKLEAINTWDNAFLTFGIFQWTVGADPGAGELPGLVQRIKQQSPDAFQKYFGQFGLDMTQVVAQPGALPVGLFQLHGTVLQNPAQKQQLRMLEWAYRFWLAGHDEAVCQAQIEHAMARVDVFYKNPTKKIRNRFIADYVTSEFGVALILDQHVNRPGHVPGTLARAVDKLTAELGSDDPQHWTDTEERRLLDLYIQLRAQTNMTDSNNRADRIRQAVRDGLASDRRGSYQA
jgi:hypothetical protein